MKVKIPTVFFQLAKVRSSSTQTPASSQKEPSNEDVTLLRQRVAELEQILRESKSDRNPASSSEEIGLFYVFLWYILVEFET